MGFLDIAEKIIDDADVVAMVLDARMPEISYNPAIKDMAERKGKKLILIFNKIDLISEEHMKLLKQRNKGAFFVSGTKNLGLRKLKTSLLIMAKKMKMETIKVGIVGYPNIGKSAIINALSHRSRALVSSVAGTTKGEQWVKAGALRIIDSPGVIPFRDNDEIKLGILGAKNPERLKNSDLVAMAIIDKFVSENKKALEDYYEIEIIEGMESYDILGEIGKKRNLLLKGGITDERRTAILIIRDWQTGKLKI